MADIFISYRRSDTGYIADQIYSEFARAFPRAEIYMDVAGDFRVGNYLDEISSQIENCKIFLVLIGNSWQSTIEERLREGTLDIVVEEIKEAIKLDKQIIPILSDGTEFPKVHNLPKSIQKLISSNAFTVRRSPYTDEDLLALTEIVRPYIKTDKTNISTNKTKIDFSDL